jgi:hypothetical protein
VIVELLVYALEVVEHFSATVAHFAAQNRDLLILRFVNGAD